MTHSSVQERYSAHLEPQTLIEMYRIMVLSRRLDERAWVLHRQGKIAFHISAIGHEACQVAAAFAIQRGIDYVYPYYRDLTLESGNWRDTLTIYAQSVRQRGGYHQQWPPNAESFQPQTPESRRGSSVVATQVPQAAGAAFAIQYRHKVGLVSPDDATQPRLALTCLGEGSTSQGEWHEGMNWAGVHHLPFICLVQNNRYAISVPYEQQSAVPNVADRAAGYGVKGLVVDGNDVFESYDGLKQAVERAYASEGPTLVEAKTYRPVPHSSDDDDRSYRSREEVEEWKKKDPILRFQNALLERGLLTTEAIETINQKAVAEVDDAHRTAENAPYPPIESLYGPVYAPLEDA